MASSSSFSCVPRTKYDVFISFAGKDTRTSFLSHLVKELRRNQIDFYMDDNRLHPGDDISSTLLQAIEESFISLVIFSEHYASSTWCLEELVKIVDCMKKDQRTVIPVFYNVDPCDVRHQKRSFGDAFDKHKERLKENMVKVKGWAYALEKAANLSGFHYPAKYQNESQLIEEIVKDVLKKISHVAPSESNDLIGIDENLKYIESLLAIESTEVQLLGIWGMGGIGKTTITEAIFAKYSSQYEDCCFLENVREKFEKHGLSYLLKTLISDLLEGENHLLKGPIKVTSANVKRRLSRKKVLIVLDDVDTPEQLEQLIGEQICLGPGSRVIVTTRNKQIFKNGHKIYEVQELDFKNSLHLFCLKAFGNVYPKFGYENLSKMAVDCAKGVPLALKVLGSFLYSRSIEAWESALRKLKVYPERVIFDVLKLSYDGLDDSEKNIFLDIAFFLKGKDKDDAISFLDSCGFYAHIGIDNLLRKALITISNSNIIQMHDLIEQMGWEIVRQESTKDPGRRSRLRHPEDIYSVLKNNKGTELVEGIMLDLSQTRDLHLKADTFKKMPYLRFLKIHHWRQRSSNVYVPAAFESFSDELRYLEWDRYPLKSLPSNFCAEKLVELRMRESQVSKLWDGVLDLVNLKKVDLFHCKQLAELPNFTNAPKLKVMDLRGCKRLCHLQSSILSVQALESLLLWGCKKLKNLIGTIHSKSLTEQLCSWNLSCLRLESLPNKLCFQMSLQELDLGGCSEITELPHNMKALSRLKNLVLTNCWSLRSLPELPPSIIFLDAYHCTSLETIFSLKGSLSLNRIQISFQDCMSLDERSLDDIAEDAYPTMVRSTIDNALKRTTNLSKMQMLSELKSYIRWPFITSGRVFYPGSKMPEWFRYQTREASVTIELDQPYQHLLGFFVCCVVSAINKPGDAAINCHYRLRDSERGTYGSGCPYFLGNPCGLDLVCVWHDPRGCDRILKDIERCRAGDHCTTYNQKITFEFIAMDYKKEAHALVKGCGVLPIYASDILDFIQKIETELEPHDRSRIYQDVDKLHLEAMKNEMNWKMKQESVPQRKILDLTSSSSGNNLEEE